MQKDPNRNELKLLERLLRRKRIRERLGFALGFKGKTVWDLLQLLIVPALLAGFTLWFNNQASIRENERNRTQREIEHDRSILQRENEQKIAVDRSQEEAMQSYLDTIANLLLEYDLLTSEPGDQVRSVARARTLTVLRGLDGARKGALVQFLYESGLIDKGHAVIKLDGADLSELDLHADNLSGAYLSGADLSKANLSYADLSMADLNLAVLGETNLSRANLSDANLSKVFLRDADLSFAYLVKADLSSADLGGAELNRAHLNFAKLDNAFLLETDLSDADLSEIDLSDADLEQTILYGVDLTKDNLKNCFFLGAKYDNQTKWPKGFDQKRYGTKKIDH